MRTLAPETFPDQFSISYKLLKNKNLFKNTRGA